MCIPSRSFLRQAAYYTFAAGLLAAIDRPALATTYYWDTNSTAAGSGSATGTWNGTNTLFSTDPSGVAAPAAVTTTNGDDLIFSAGTNGTAGTVTVSATQLAHSLTFDDPVAVTVSGGTAINLGSALGGSGLFFTANGANTISTPVILNSAATVLDFTNSGTSNQLISSTITGAAATGTQTINLGANGTGSLFLTGIVGNGAAGGLAALNVNGSGTGLVVLSAANTFTGGVTLNSGTLNLNNAAALGGAAGTFTINGGVVDVTSTGTITAGANPQAWNADFTFGGTRNLAFGAGAVTILSNRVVTVNSNAAQAARSALSGLLTVSGVVGGGAVSLTKAGTGTLLLSGTANTFSGGISITGGALRLAGAGSGLTANNVALSGGVLEFAFAPAASYTLGTGAGQINFAGNGGFSAAGGARSVALNAGAALAWGTTANFIASGNVLLLGGPQSDNSVTLTNAIDLGGVTRTIDATRGTGLSVVDGVLSGAITNGSLTKTGNGTLQLSSATTALTGTTTISGGTLIFNNQTTAIANTAIVLNGGVLGLPSGNFTATLGTGNGQVSFAPGSASGGFSSFGAERTVSIGGAGASLVWNSTPNFLQTGALVLNSSSSGNTTVLSNGLDFNGADRTIQVEDGNATDDARIDGVVTGAGSLIKTGGGVGGGARLFLNAVNTYTGATILRQGEIVVSNSVLSGVAGPLGNSSSAIVIGDSQTLSGNDNNGTTISLVARPAATAAGDAQTILINRGIDFSQAGSAILTTPNVVTGLVLGRYRIAFSSNGGAGLDTDRLTLAGPINFGTNGRGVEFYTERAGQVFEVTGDITGSGNTLYLSSNSNGGASATDGRTNATYRFSNVARPFSSGVNVTVGTLLIEGSVTASGSSPVGTGTPSLGDGNGGNILSGNGRDAVRSIFLETPGATYARGVAPGGGSAVTPTAGAQQTAYGTGSSSLINGYRFGGTNTSGTVTYSGSLSPGGVNTSITGTAAGLGGTNPATVPQNVALFAATGGTVDFTGAITGSTATPLGATGTPGAASGTGNNTRITVNQFRNHPNLDENVDGTADLGLANALVGSPTAGTVVLSGTNSYGATTEILGGTLRLNYATNNTTKLADAAALVFSGGTVELSGGSHVEVVGSTTVTANTANNVTRSTGTSTLRLNAINRSAGSLLNFGAGSIADTDSVNTNGILGPWATVGGSDFATNVAGTVDQPVVAYTGYSDVTRTDSGTQVIANSSTTNYRIGEGTGTAGNVTLGAPVTAINTLNQSTVGGSSAATVDPAGQTLAVGGVLVGSGAGGLTVGTGVNNGTVTAAVAGGELILQNNSGNALTVNSVIADNTSASTLTVGGTGRTVLTGANSHTGATVVNSGVLNIRSNTALGTVAAGTVVANGAALEIQGGIIVGAEALTLGGSGVANGGALRNVSGVNSFAGATTLTADTRINSDSGQLTVSGAIALPTVAVSAYTLTFGGAGDIIASGPISISSTAAGYLGSVAKDGAGNLTLSGTNTYAGGTTLTAGTLTAGNTTAFGSAASALTVAGGALDSSVVNLTIANNNQVNINGDFAFTGTQNLNLGTGAVSLGNAVGTVRMITANANNLTFGGVISNGSTATNLTKAGAGSLTLSGTAANTYTGTTTVTGGTLVLAKTAAINAIAGNLTIGDGAGNDLVRLTNSNQIADASIVTLVGSGVNAGILRLNNQSETLGGLSSVSGEGIVENESGTAVTSTLNLNVATGTQSFGGTLRNGDGVGTDGTLALTKSGVGIQVLTGANNYTGPTAVSAGTLQLIGSISATSSVAVTGGTLTLGAADRINNAASVSLGGGTLATGGFSEGTTATAGLGLLTVTANSFIDFGAGTGSQLFFAGVGTHSGGTLSISNYEGNPTGGGPTDDRLVFTGNVTDFTSIYQPSDVIFNGLSGFTAIPLSGGIYEIVPVPEPSSVALLGSLVLFGLRRTRRHRA